MKDAEPFCPMITVAIILAALCLLIGTEPLLRPAAIRRRKDRDE